MAAVPMSSALTVFGLPAQAETARVLTCFFEKELNFELVRRESYRSGDGYRASEFIKEPSGQVIVREGGRRLVSGSRDICRYVCEQYPTSGQRLLLGAGDMERVSIEEWIRKESQFFDPASTSLVQQLTFNPMICKPRDNAIVEANEQKLRELLDEYEDQLGEYQFLAGSTFSLADLFHLPNTEYLFKTSLGYNLITERNNVNRWWGLISGRDSWKKVQGMQKEHPGAFPAQ